MTEKPRNLAEESTYDGVLYFGTLMEKLRQRQLDESGDCPIGSDYLTFAGESLANCQDISTEAIKRLSQPESTRLESLGTLLSLLDRLASCTWGCSKGDHVIENIMGRVVGYSQSAFWLAKSGLYDEALLLVRSVAEVANLFTYFSADPQKFRQWKTADPSKRIHEFGPAAIRKGLKNIGVSPPCDTARYKHLCEIAAHVTPTTTPQVHESGIRPSTGGLFQAEGFHSVLTELSIANAYTGIAACSLADIPEKKREEITEQADVLLKSC